MRGAFKRLEGHESVLRVERDGVRLGVANDAGATHRGLHGQRETKRLEEEGFANAPSPGVNVDGETG